MPSISEVKANAKAAGVRWSDVVELYRELRSMERPAVEHDHEIRRAIWEQYCWTPGCAQFWFVGMERRFPRAFADGDRTLIPRFDEMADGLAMSYPQFACDDPSEKVWDFLTSPPQRFTEAGKLYSDALEMILHDRVEVGCDAVPF